MSESTLWGAVEIARRIRSAAPGYLVGLGGSTLFEGRGRDYDFVLVRQAEYPLGPDAVAANLRIVLGPDVTPWSCKDDAWGGVFETPSLAIVDVALLGYGCDPFVRDRWLGR